jgi:aspartyl protease family protein
MSLAGGNGPRIGGYLLIGLVIGVAALLLLGLLLLLLPKGVAGDALLAYAATAAVLLVLALLRDATPVLKWAVRLVLVWVGVGLLLYYGFQHSGLPGRQAGAAPAAVDAVHVVGDSPPVPVPSGQPVASDSLRPIANGESLSFTMSPDGHFRVQASVGATNLSFLVDTGASNVLLSPADARRLGYNTAALSYTQIYRTADGEVHAAPLILPEVDIGPIRVSNVPASVFEREAGASLLGMSFLSRLSGYEVVGNVLTLHQ